MSACVTALLPAAAAAAPLTAFDMSRPDLGSSIVPKPSEVTDGMRRWQQELDSIHAYYDRCRDNDKTAFESERRAIEASVSEKRAEQMARLNAEIHQYMRLVQEGMDSLLDELKNEKLHNLELEYQDKQKKLGQARDERLLEHLKTYRSMLVSDGSSDSPVSPPHPAFMRQIARFD